MRQQRDAAAQRVAITREISPSIARCELTHLERRPIDLQTARAQHRAYEAALAVLGCQVQRLPAEPDLPDAVFVEDAAVVLDDLAILMRPGAASRRPETASVARALEPFRELVYIEAPATIDGGDVLVVGRTLYVGRSTRTNAAALDALRALVEPRGYRVAAVDVRGALHLKSGATRVDDTAILANPGWVDVTAFAGLEVIEVDPAEPSGGNALRVGDTVLYPAEHPRTRQRLEAHGVRTVALEAGELAKAEGGLTCCSLIFELV